MVARNCGCANRSRIESIVWQLPKTVAKTLEKTLEKTLDFFDGLYRRRLGTYIKKYQSKTATKHTDKNFDQKQNERQRNHLDHEPIDVRRRIRIARHRDHDRMLSRLRAGGSEIGTRQAHDDRLR